MQVKEEIYGVWYREDGEHTLHRTEQGFEADFSDVLWRGFRIGGLLIAPFMISCSLYLYYRRKEKQTPYTDAVS